MMHRLRGEPLEPRALLTADLIITEFVASNDTGIRDEDQLRSDWIEILNDGTEAVDLGGWFLTDDADDLDKWEFPATEMRPNERIVVFASGKNRRVSGSELHTNFRLNFEGEYLALVQPDGITPQSEFAPAYPMQIRDASFGRSQAVQQGIPMVPDGGSGRVLIPTVTNGGSTLGASWTAADFDDSAWTPDVVGIGYERLSGYESLISTDVGSMMYNVNRSAYLRMPFELEHPERVASFTLTMQYDDGYVAYINGQEVARQNAPDELAWDSGATAAHADRFAIRPQSVEIIVANFQNLLRPGPNVLAIHALNDTIDSSDFLLIPRLTADIFESVQRDEYRYFSRPSPGAPNGVGSTTSILEVAHTPQKPNVGDPITVTATLATTGDAYPEVMLHYRVMFDDEIAVPMTDDGQSGDLVAGDGIYGAVLPAGLAAPGQMIRYRVVAGSAETDAARLPLFQDPLKSEEYFGTVIHDPNMLSNLPVIHTFLADPAAANVQPGTFGSLYYDGRFYDNIEMDPHGRSVGLAGPKKSHDVQFPSDHWFELEEGSLRMNDFIIISDFWNRAKVRVPLGYQTLQALGTPSHLSFPVRVQQNGEFYGTYFFVDGGNDKFLERAGVDPTGALYKMNLGFGLGLGTYRKETRRHEDNSDLRDFFAGMALEGEARTTYLMDHVNIDAMVNFLVGLVIMGHGDCCGKNLYLYRDTEGSGQWQALPWDVDSAFGRGGVGESASYYPTAGGIFSGLSPDNVLITALFADVPGFREMYLRRLRTLMDEFVQPPDTPENERYFEAQIDAMVQQLAPDAALDFAKWGSWKTDPVTGAITFGTEGVPTWEEEVAALRNGYLPARRQHLYSQLRQVNGGRELPAQIGSPRIDFGDILASPESGNQDEEYIQLRNPNNFAVDLSGWRITGGIQHVFTPGTVLPAGGTLYVSPDLNAFRARENGPRGGQRLHVQGDYVGRLPNIGSELQLIGLDDQVVAQATATGSLTPAQQFLRISELMYNPRSLPNDGRFAAQDFEYIELVNTATTTTVELQHVALSQGVEFQFPNMTLGPGQRTVVVRNEAAFRHRHGDSISIAGQYGGTEDEWALSNAGEPLVLGLGADERIQEFTYEDDWVPSTDGDGYSMEIIDLHSDMSTWNTAAAWQASRDVDGSPGRDGSGQGDFNGDGSVNVADLTLFCAALSNNDPTYDLDGNQQVNSQDLLFLVHGLMGSTIGDVNFDRQFNSRDLVLIFQTGKFEMPAATASYVEGDWNCDGTFSTADFVFALQHSQYQVDSRPAGIVAARSSVWPSQVDAVFANVDRRPPNQLAWLERSRSFT